MTQEKIEVVKLITFGRGGDTLYFAKHSTCSGYGSPERPHAADFTAEHHSGYVVPDGTYAIDSRSAVDTDKGFHMAVSGPLVNVDLEAGKVERCPEPSSLLVAGVADNSYGGMLALQKAHRATAPEAPGPLDGVDIETYVRMWRDAGARIGRYHDYKIVWDD